jgi:hypothetical protein
MKTPRSLCNHLSPISKRSLPARTRKADTIPEVLRATAAKLANSLGITPYIRDGWI